MSRGDIVDLSLSGAFMLLPELPDPRQPVKLTIDLPKFHPLVLSAELVRFDILPEGNGSSHRYGLAVRFLNFASEHRLLLFNALRIWGRHSCQVSAGAESTPRLYIRRFNRVPLLVSFAIQPQHAPVFLVGGMNVAESLCLMSKRTRG